ncbi:MAG: hypothetical protein J6C27_00955 [Clostridia bacterium]|nr:hypothetical protein [Clostridia bacterium]
MTHFEEIKQMNVDELAAVINDSRDVFVLRCVRKINIPALMKSRTALRVLQNGLRVK